MALLAVSPTTTSQNLMRNISGVPPPNVRPLLRHHQRCQHGGDGLQAVVQIEARLLLLASWPLSCRRRGRFPHLLVREATRLLDAPLRGLEQAPKPGGVGQYEPL